MKRLTKKQSQQFTKDCIKMLKDDLGVFDTESNGRSYNLGLKTPIGTLFLRVDDDNRYGYAVFGNYLGNEQKAKELYGHWKQNIHLISELSPLEAVDEVKQFYRKYLN